LVQLCSPFRCGCSMTYESCETSSDQIGYTRYFDILVATDAGKAALKKEAEANFSPELTKFFFDDYPAWISLFNKEEKGGSSIKLQPINETCELEMSVFVTAPMTTSSGILESAPPTPTLTPEVSMGRELGDTSPEMSQIQFEPPKTFDDEKVNKVATYIYRTYIEERAPLSLNLSVGLRQDIEDRLFGFGGTTIVASRDDNPSTMFNEVHGVVRELIFTNLYNLAFHSKEVQDGFETSQRVLDCTKGPL